jgi:hypothetical protein
MNSRQEQLQALEIMDIMDELRENVHGIKSNHAKPPTLNNRGNMN